MAGAAVLVLATAPSCLAAQAMAGTAATNPATAAGTTSNQARPAPAELPQWDVVSVRPVALEKCTQGSGVQYSKDGVSAFCVPLFVVIESAYEIIDPSRIVGAPQWVKSGGFWNIDAKVAGEDLAAFSKLAPKDKDRMLQPLLADRFHLKAHMEQREMPIYELVAAKSGPKLKEATADEASQARIVSRGRGKIECVDMALASLPWILNQEVGRPVVDKTGLTGKYDFTLEYVPAAKAATDESGGASIFTALEEQLGLKLEPAKAPMDVLVIDSIEQPAAN